jgi:hypothetical protein
MKFQGQASEDMNESLCDPQLPDADSGNLSMLESVTISSTENKLHHNMTTRTARRIQ